MQAVSSLWCQIWHSTSLSLDMRAFSTNENNRIIIAGKILAAHRGPIHYIVLVSYCLERYNATFEDWLKLPMLNNLSQLDFQFATKNTTTDQEADMTYSLVLSSLCFSPTLQVVNLSRCCIPDDLITRPLHFPKLRKLNLHSIRASEDALHAMISACPSLESRNINYTIGLPRLCIRPASIRSLCIGTTHGLKQEAIFQERVVEDAPLLERLIPAFLDDGHASIRVISAPRLEILGILRRFISRLEIGTVVI
uniref:F-box/LRR-repeat protein 15/At3g58940/PEG3-like LRR domain-containing protein n=1 Tax=Oryza brachyantha TaxID=4533 RepID=J3L8I4_ORYBR